MGLAISYAIITQQGGTLQIASEPGRGATIRIALPVEHKPAQVAPTPETPSVAEQRHGRVLVIDDEPAIVDLVTRLLKRNGYIVSGVQQARLAFDELGRQIYDTVLCDIRMPDMDGIAFHRRLESLNLEHGPRLVIMTGDTSNARTEDFLRQHDLPVLRKPFTRQELLAVIAGGS
jgi:CheY-like chemotaxis protein